MWEKSDEDGCGGEEKERKTEAEVDGQCKCGLEGKGTVWRGDAQLGCVEATCQINRPNVEVGKDAEEEEEERPTSSRNVSTFWRYSCSEMRRDLS